MRDYAHGPCDCIHLGTQHGSGTAEPSLSLRRSTSLVRGWSDVSVREPSAPHCTRSRGEWFKRGNCSTVSSIFLRPCGIIWCGGGGCGRRRSGEQQLRSVRNGRQVA